MTWVWDSIVSYASFPEVEMDYNASEPLYSSIEFRNPEQANTSHRPVFRTRGSIKKFIARHCPPIGVDPVVDEVWQNIIKDFASPQEVGFMPIELVGRDGSTIKFSWLLCFNEIECINLSKSVVHRDRKNPSVIFRIDEYAHFENCLGSKHIARDLNESTHIVISDALHEALASTGEYAMFHRPEDVPTMFGKNSVFKRSQT